MLLSSSTVKTQEVFRISASKQRQSPWGWPSQKIPLETGDSASMVLSFESVQVTFKCIKSEETVGGEGTEGKLQTFSGTNDPVVEITGG